MGEPNLPQSGLSRAGDGTSPLDLVDGLQEAPDDCPYDQELGRRMGIDAMRVANDELDEQEFHEKYEDELVAEFGDDYAPAEMMDRE